MIEAELCRQVDESMSSVLEGVASEELFDHIAGCERCRDARHAAEQIVERVARAGADYRFPQDLAARLTSILDAGDARPQNDAGGTAPAAPSAPASGQASAAPSPSFEEQATEEASGITRAPHPLAKREAEPPRLVQVTPLATPPRSVWVWLSAAAAVLLGILWLGSRPDAEDTRAAALGAWQGEVLQVQRAFGSPSGLSLCDAAGACTAAGVGDPIPPGARLSTDGLTRALVRFGDGTRLALDRASQLELDASERRRARLVLGNVVAEVQERVESAAPTGAPRSVPSHERAIFESAFGRAEVLGTKLALRADRELLRVEVSRGAVKLVDAEDRAALVQAGEAGSIGARVAPRVESVLNLAPAFAWPSEAFDASSNEERHPGALGELRAKRPRDQDERSHAVSLTEHHVKVRIVDNVARTEIEEVFTNQTDEVLEGIYRFPLPPGAQIERLALDVDGKLIDGAFVERERAAAIWRGAIVNSGGKKAPAEEIVWVPGPWKDPALLEWQRGNRFELRIFPIPRRGARRIVLAYTQLLAPTEGGREYVYPLPLDPGGTTRAERFTFEAEVRGHDPLHGVTPRGYPLSPSMRAPGVARLTFEAERFSPVGDLAITYRLPSSAGPIRAWAYQPSATIEPPTRRSDVDRPRGTVASGGVDGWHVPASAPYVAIALRPELPRRAEHAPRDYVLIADASRSMIGENYRRAIAVVERTIAEMDRHDRVAVLACDSACQSLPGGYRVPGPEAAEAAARFLRGIGPEGASDLAFAVEQAASLAAREGHADRALRVVYVGDGTPTVGPIHPALLGRAVSEAMPRAATLTAVAIGSDADRASLEVATEAAGGVTLAFAPGQSAEEVAYAILGATYGHSLKNARLLLPDGLVAVAPGHLGTISAGGEELVVARMARPEVTGEAVLRGEVAGEPFEQRYTLNVSATTSEGNAFVPRLYAAVAIAELDRSMDESARRRSIELSTRFNVASRYTSLLVLESAAMFKAFGLDNRRLAPEWSGEQESSRAETWGETENDETDAMSAALADPWSDAASFGGLTRATPAGKSATGAGGLGARSRALGDGSLAPGAAPSASAPRPAPARQSAAADLAEGWAEDPGRRGAEKKKERRDGDVARDDCGCSLSDWECRSSCRSAQAPVPPLVERPRILELPTRPMIPMRRVWDRLGRIDVPPRLLEAASPSRRARLEARVHELELSRSALKDLYVVDFLAGDLERAADTAARWSEKDPLDPDALTARADLAAQRGDRELAIRILGSVVDVRPGDHKAQWRLARLHRWAGAPARGCRHSLAVAQLMLTDAKLVAEAVRCARDVGQRSWAEDLLAAVSADVRSRVERLSAEPRPSDELAGDLRVRASWHGAEHDLDLVILHPEGYRVSWLGAPTRAVITANDVLSLHREGLALRGADAGEYAIEVVRTSPTFGVVRGTIDLRVGKEERSVPFVLEGERIRVATAQIKLQSRLVPLDEWPK